MSAYLTETRAEGPEICDTSSCGVGPGTCGSSFRRSCGPLFSKTEIERALGTRDRAEAQEMRWAVVSDIKTSIEKLRSARGDTGQLVAWALKDRREAAAWLRSTKREQFIDLSTMAG
jgi:hypothetical protein